ncbi:MAG TPA: helix-hairpin-helix domain-containing protein [Campylobacterales bacterium]|nr:helix-hairpin-helix domain-containing protein [Campylobacterales bacterium]HIO70614.1 helix-hairpin-helix domain-containing protein [Campylobacterales bacterium]
MWKLLISALLLSTALFGIDFQTASKSELMSIHGIGKKLAERIIEYRKKNKIKSVDDLIHVKGIGKKKLQKIKEFLKAEKSSKGPKAKIDLSKYKK